MLELEVPFQVMPHVEHAWRSVHGTRKRQSFVIHELWGIHLYRYSADVLMNGQKLAIEPGYGGFTPPGAVMEYRFRGHSTHVFAHVRWPLDAPRTPLPAMFPIGRDFGVLWDRLEEAIPWVNREPLRADVRVYDVLLGILASLDARNLSSNLPRLAQGALQIIEERLAQPLDVGEIASQLGVSPGHLVRVVRLATGQTVVGTIQQRRVERALHLLKHTDLPVKEVAGLVGLPDLQHFNKSMRRAHGKSPTAIRSDLGQT